MSKNLLKIHNKILNISFWDHQILNFTKLEESWNDKWRILRKFD